MTMPPRPAPPTPLRPRPATSAPPPPDPLAAALVAALRPMVAEVVREALAEFAESYVPPVAREPKRDLLTTDQACAVLQVTRGTLSNWRAGGCPCVMLGDSPRFRIADVIRWSEQRARERQAEAAE